MIQCAGERNARMDRDKNVIAGRVSLFRCAEGFLEVFIGQRWVVILCSIIIIAITGKN